MVILIYNSFYNLKISMSIMQMVMLIWCLNFFQYSTSYSFNCSCSLRCSSTCWLSHQRDSTIPSKSCNGNKIQGWWILEGMVIITSVSFWQVIILCLITLWSNHLSVILLLAVALHCVAAVSWTRVSKDWEIATWNVSFLYY